MKIIITILLITSLLGHTYASTQVVSEKKISHQKQKDSTQAAAKNSKKKKKSQKKVHNPSAWDKSRTGDTAKKQN